MLLAIVLVLALGFFLTRALTSPSTTVTTPVRAAASYQVGFNDGVLNAGLESASSTPIRPKSDCQALARTLAGQQGQSFLQGCVVGEQRFKAELHR